MEATPPDNPQTDHRRKPGKTKRYTRYILDPFQIFCIEKRNDYMREHPDLRNSDVTSILAGIWRSMSEKEKQAYNIIAMQLQNNKCNVERKTKKAQPKTEQTKDTTSTSTPEISEPDVEADPKVLFKPSAPPKIYVVSRTGVGEELSEVSYNLLRMQDQDSD